MGDCNVPHRPSPVRNIKQHVGSLTKSLFSLWRTQVLAGVGEAVQATRHLKGTAAAKVIYTSTGQSAPCWRCKSIPFDVTAAHLATPYLPCQRVPANRSGRPRWLGQMANCFCRYSSSETYKYILSHFFFLLYNCIVLSKISVSNANVWSVASKRSTLVNPLPFENLPNDRFPLMSQKERRKRNTHGRQTNEQRDGSTVE